MKIPLINNEKILDNLVDEMNDEEYQEYQNLWDSIDPWRRALNWVTRLALLLLTVGYIWDNDFWAIFGLAIAVPLLPAGLFLSSVIWTSCGRLIIDIYTRLDRI